jgi:FixJ family two-component response regulator
MSISETDKRTIRRQVVVLVDDDPQILAALGRLLRDEEFDVMSTIDPQEALEWIRSRDVGVLIADDRMPVISGTSLFHLAKSCSPKTARIMLTGYAGEGLIVHARKEGLYLVFAKPWDDRELKRVIRERLREREVEGMLPEA